MLRLKPISDDLILDRLKFENPWWTTALVGSEYRDLPFRVYFELFYPIVEEREPKRAVVLMGPRRVGKTVMMHHAIDRLLYEKKVKQRQVCFINIENPLYRNIDLEQLFSLCRVAANSPEPDDWYVFFDEIQYLNGWEIHLKVLVDSYPNTKFIVSGSAAAALKVKSTESGAGRFTDFMLPPLTFHEYIEMKEYGALISKKKIHWEGQERRVFTTTRIEEVNNHFIDYINFGGYPEVIFSEKIRQNPGRYIKSDIVDKVLLHDLPSIYGIQNVQELHSFFTVLAYYSGCEVSLSALSITSSIDANTLKKYMEYLEAAFLVKQIHRIDDNAKKFKRANFYKVCLTNPSLRSALFSPLKQTDDLFGNLVETAIYSQWLHRDWIVPYYARWPKGGEVDMVGLDNKKLKPTWAVEIKWSNRFYENPYELKSLLYFCKRNNLKTALVTTIDKEGVQEIEGVTINYIPSALYAYTIGVNTIIHKLHD